MVFSAVCTLFAVINWHARKSGETSKLSEKPALFHTTEMFFATRVGRYQNHDTGRLSLRTKLAYGAPMFSLTSLTLLLGVVSLQRAAGGEGSHGCRGRGEGPSFLRESVRVTARCGDTAFFFPQIVFDYVVRP